MIEVTIWAPKDRHEELMEKYAKNKAYRDKDGKIKMNIRMKDDPKLLAEYQSRIDVGGIWHDNGAKSKERIRLQKEEEDRQKWINTQTD